MSKRQRKQSNKDESSLFVLQVNQKTKSPHRSPKKLKQRGLTELNEFQPEQMLIPNLFSEPVMNKNNTEIPDISPVKDLQGIQNIEYVQDTTQEEENIIELSNEGILQKKFNLPVFQQKPGHTHPHSNDLAQLAKMNGMSFHENIPTRFTGSIADLEKAYGGFNIESNSSVSSQAYISNYKSNATGLSHKAEQVKKQNEEQTNEEDFDRFEKSQTKRQNPARQQIDSNTNLNTTDQIENIRIPNRQRNYQASQSTSEQHPRQVSPTQIPYPEKEDSQSEEGDQLIHQIAFDCEQKLKMKNISKQRRSKAERLSPKYDQQIPVNFKVTQNQQNNVNLSNNQRKGSPSQQIKLPTTGLFGHDKKSGDQNYSIFNQKANSFQPVLQSAKQNKTEGQVLSPKNLMSFQDTKNKQKKTPITIVEESKEVQKPHSSLKQPTNYSRERKKNDISKNNQVRPNQKKIPPRVSPKTSPKTKANSVNDEYIQQRNEKLFDQIFNLIFINRKKECQNQHLIQDDDICFSNIDFSYINLDLLEALMPLFTDIEIAETDFQIKHQQNRYKINQISPSSTFCYNKQQFIQKLRAVWKSQITANDKVKIQKMFS